MKIYIKAGNIRKNYLVKLIDKEMKRTLWISSFVLLIALTYVFLEPVIQDLIKESKRTAYENQLHEVLKQLPTQSRELDTIAKADRPDVAALQNYFQTLDPALGVVPVKRQYSAYEQAQILQNQSTRNRELMWEGTRADMGGRTRALLFDPNDSQGKKVFAGGVTGGLWVNYDILDLSEDWEPIGDFYPNLAISSLTYDPTNSLVLYAGTGEAQTARIIYRESSGLGMGIFKSEDGGDSWEIMPSTADFAYVTDVKVRDEDGVGVIYAAVVSGSYQGADHQSEPSDGLYRSTDGGESWEQVLPIIPETDEPYAPAMIEIASNGRIFIGTTENLQKKGGATVLWSDEGTAGSWTAFEDYNTIIENENYYNIPARTIIASAPSDPDIVYAQFAAGYLNSENGFYHYRGRYMAKSTDGGETWSTMNKPANDWSTLAWHAFILKVQPDDPNSLFTGGLDLWKSSNGGQSWNHISDWVLMYYGGGDEYVHADQHQIAFRPNDPTTAIFGCDGGVFLSENAHLSIPTFTERNQNYNTLQFYSGAINPTAGSQQLLGGLQDNGSLKYTGNTLDINDMISGGDGAACFWDQNESNLYITSVYYNRYYFYKNNNQYDYIDGGSGTFVSPADYDYINNILYTNAVDFLGNYAGRIYRITNVGSQVSGGFIDLGTFNTIPFSHIAWSQHSTLGNSTIFAGTGSGRLYKVENANTSPAVTEIGSPDFPLASVSAVAIGGSEDTLMVSFSNYGVSSIWLTFDGGENWLEREGNLPDMPVRWAILHPENSEQAMLATETGIWTTNMLFEDEPLWEPSTEGMGNVRVDMLRMRLSDNTVMAASHGRGLFTAVWEKEVYTFESETPYQSDSFVVYPNPVSDFVHLQTKLEGNYDLQIVDMQGKVVVNKKLVLMSGNDMQIDINHLPSGHYVLQLSNANYKLSQKIIKE